jgi:predicted enzyme related to lactoylglutathione lyase
MKAGAVLYVKQLDRMSRFYRECFRLRTATRADDHCVLESDAWTLSLVVVPDEIAAAIHLTAPPRRREGTPIKLAFEVPSIDDLRLTVAGLGGRVDPRETRWDFAGSSHCDCVDPEGNVIQLLERLGS